MKWKRHLFLLAGLLLSCPSAARSDESEATTVADACSSKKVTEGVIRVRRRHENDMDFSRYNPFYWQGRRTSFRVEDFTPCGTMAIVFTLTTEWPQDYTPTRGPDFSAIYKGDPVAPSEALRSKFEINSRMSHMAENRIFQATIGPNAFAAYPESLKPGNLLVFEFRFFNNESHPEWQRQKATDPQTISAYYSEFFRIRIGEAGLLIDNPQDDDGFAPEESYAGGGTTIPTVRVEPWRALQQIALNLTTANEQAFLDGRTWFHTDFTGGQHVDDATDAKPMLFFEEDRIARSGLAGTAFNARSCSACHINNGIALLPDLGSPVDRTIVKTLDSGSGNAHPNFGPQLQTLGADAEGILKVASYTTNPVTLKDGTVVELKKPNFVVEGANVSTEGLALAPRKVPALIGLGLLDAVPDQTILDFAKASKGQVSEVNGRIGRFGWKAGQVTVKDQIMAALNNDLAVTSRGQPELGCAPRCQTGKGFIDDKAVDLMNAYVSLLGVPARRNPSDAGVLRGQEVFRELNCQSCHIEKVKTGPSEFSELAHQTIAPYTDLLLHDMGEGLADPAGPLASKWRTAPLWGLKNVRHATDSHAQEFPAGNINIIWTDAQAVADKNPMQFLHDGRAASIPEAILWHGGEAEDAVLRYKELSKADRDALEAFLWDL